MKPVKIFTLNILLTILMVSSLQAQENTKEFTNQFVKHFNYANRIVDLAEAIPSDKFSWRPDEGVMSVEEVYVHIAQSNYYYLINVLGLPAPEGLDMEGMDSIEGKENVIKLLNESNEFVNSAVVDMPDSKFDEMVELYGQTVNGQGVLMQLVTHLSEHTGQLIAYARMNGVVPPWSQ